MNSGFAVGDWPPVAGAACNGPGAATSPRGAGASPAPGESTEQ